MGKRLTQQQLARYRRNGFFSPLPVLTPDEAQSYRQRFERFELENNGWYELSKGQKLYLLQTWVAELVSNDAILDAVEDVLGAHVLCWGCSLFVKEAEDPAYVSWHQDSTYWGLSSPDVVTAWIALSPASRVSGCMKMLPGSHTLDQLPHKDTLASQNLLTRGQEVQMTVNDDDAMYLPLEPGEASLHHIRTIHASDPNRSNQRRIGLAVRYIAGHVHQLHAPKDSAWLLRGEDRHGHFVLETPPEQDMDAAAIAQHERIMQLRHGILYKGVKGQPAHDRPVSVTNAAD